MSIFNKLETVMFFSKLTAIDSRETKLSMVEKNHILMFLFSFQLSALENNQHAR